MIAPRCPACPGSGFLLGALGARKWFRCRNCGIDFSRAPKPRKPKKMSMDAAIWAGKLGIQIR